MLVSLGYVKALAVTIIKLYYLIWFNQTDWYIDF